MFDRLIALVGGISCGTGRRCQNFVNEDFHMKDSRHNCQQIRSAVVSLQKSSQVNYHETTTKELRKSASKTISGLASRCRLLGILSVAHIVHTLCLIGMAPMFLLSFAVILDTATQNKRKQMSPTMVSYLSASSGIGTSSDSTDSNDKKGKFATLLSSLTRYLRDRCNIRHLNEGTAENILCEASRSNPAHDLFFGGNWLYRELPPSDGPIARGHTNWVAIIPCVDDRGNLFCKRKEPTDAMSLFEDENTGRSVDASTGIWDVGSMSPSDMMHVGGKRDRKTNPGHKNPIENYVISKEEIAVFPGLLEKIKLAMAHHTSNGNRHVDVMARLNSIDELKEIVSQCGTKQANATSRRNAARRTLEQRDHGGHPPLRKTRKRKAAPLPAKALRRSKEDPSLVSATVLKRARVGGNAHVVPLASGQKQAKAIRTPTLPVQQSALVMPPHEGVWQNGGNMELVQIKAKVRTYPLPSQLRGTLLPGGCLGFSDSDSFDEATTILQWDFRIPPTNLVHSVIARQNKGIPRVSYHKKGKKGNTSFRTEMVAGKQMFRASCEFVPETAIGTDGCQLQNIIARSLEGIKVKTSNTRNSHYWYFPTRDLAMDHFALCVLCVMGEEKYYHQLRSDVLKHNSSRATGQQGDDGRTTVILGYPMERSKTDDRRGVVGYFILANNKKEVPSGEPLLAIAIPSRPHSRIRANGVPVNRRTLGKGDITHIFRLL
jgi:hypothetical protein